MMRFELDEYNRGIEDDVLIADLQKVAQLLSKESVTTYEYNDYGKYSSSTISRRFGTWFAALDKAGLKRTRNLGITDEQLFQNLETVWISLGRQPRYADMNAQGSAHCAKTYENRFGSWLKALNAFVEYSNEDPFLTEEHSESEPIAIPACLDASIEALKESDHRPTQNFPNGLHQTKRNVSHRLRFIVFRRDNFRCVICGRSPATDLDTELVVDHKAPWSKGGETRLDNLQTLCVMCNSGKSDLAMDSQ